MANNGEKLWSFSKTAAILAIPIVWILFAILFFLTQKYSNWPGSESRELVMIVVIVVSFTPLALVLLDFAAKRRAVLDIKGVKLDFSQTDITIDITGLPDNIGDPGALVTDSSPMKIMSTLERAIENDVVRIDLKAGNAWWATRLLALSAGAVRAGSPKVIVFTGVKENINGCYFGWADPNAIQKAILNDKEGYLETYRKSARIAKQVAMFGANEMLPIITDPNQFLALNGDVQRYTISEEERNYASLGDAVFEQILMDQLALLHESPPDRITLGRLDQLFEHCIYRDIIDLDESSDKQLSRLLDSQSPYIALVNGKRFQRLLKREAGERVILKQLFQQSK